MVRFSLAGVISDAIRFNQSLVGLDGESVGLLFDVLEKGSYKILKEYLIQSLSVGETTKRAI